MANTEAEIYPIDVQALSKGDVIPVERIENITGETRGTPAFALATLGLRVRIENELRDIGTPMCLRGFQGESLKVLTDEEASAYKDLRAKSHLRGLARSVRDLQEVDRSRINKAGQDEHDRRLFVHGRTLQAALAGRSDAIKAVPHVRATPVLDDEYPTAPQEQPS